MDAMEGQAPGGRWREALPWWQSGPGSGAPLPAGTRGTWVAGSVLGRLQEGQEAPLGQLPLGPGEERGSLGTSASPDGQDGRVGAPDRRGSGLDEEDDLDVLADRLNRILREQARRRGVLLR